MMCVKQFISDRPTGELFMNSCKKKFMQIAHFFKEIQNRFICTRITQPQALVRPGIFIKSRIKIFNEKYLFSCDTSQKLLIKMAING